MKKDNLPERKKNFQQQRQKALRLIEQFHNSWILSHTTTCHTTNAGAITHSDTNNAASSSSSTSSVNMSDMACNECINELQKICCLAIPLKTITLSLLEATSKYYY